MRTVGQVLKDAARQFRHNACVFSVGIPEHSERHHLVLCALVQAHFVQHHGTLAVSDSCEQGFGACTCLRLEPSLHFAGAICNGEDVFDRRVVCIYPLKLGSKHEHHLCRHAYNPKLPHWHCAGRSAWFQLFCEVLCMRREPVGQGGHRRLERLAEVFQTVRIGPRDEEDLKTSATFLPLTDIGSTRQKRRVKESQGRLWVNDR